jgi:hypothetical protein
VALGGTLNVMTMMSANLVGFSIGTDGVKFMWHELLGSWAGQSSPFPYNLSLFFFLLALMLRHFFL